MAAAHFQQQIAAVALAPGQFLQSANAKANGLMKRNSFFSRPESRNSVDRDAPTLHATRSSRDVPRSQSAVSTHERQSTDGGKRRSMFGSRKRSSRRETQAREPCFEYESQEVLPLSPSRFDFDSENEFYRAQRKHAISPPFNFQHVSHTHKRHVPDLTTVDERELSKEFWASAAYQRPQSHLNGIRAEDLAAKLESMGVRRGSMSSSRPTTPALSEHPANRQRRPMSPLSQRDRKAANSTQYPRRQSSLESRKTSSPPDSPQKVSPVLPIASQFLGSASEFPSICTTMKTATKLPDLSQIRYRASQPLPALPMRSRSGVSLPDSTSRGDARNPRDSLTATSGRPPLSPSSRKSFGSIRRGPAPVWSTPDLRSSGGMSEAAWEDDVDFSYEHEAEATCDFDWDATETTPRTLPEKSDVDMAMPGFSEADNGARASCESVDQSSERPRSIVGHHGFLQARHTDSQTNSPNLSTKTSPLLPIAEHMPKQVRADSVNGDYPSDPESSFNASSFASSTGSHDSCTSMSKSMRGDHHNSIASLSSVPELVHSRSTLSGSNPDLGDQAGSESTSIPRKPVPTANGNVEVFRRPSTLSNRAILQAGRAVQRGRPATPSRFSRLLQAPAMTEAHEEEEPAWI